MSGFTGIEFGPDSCTLVQARRRAEGIELTAAHIVEPSEWPRQTADAAELLKRIRREKTLPRVARVVAWGLAEGAGPRDIATRAALRPLISAGFRIDAVVSPPQALGILAADRPRPGGAAAVWLAINRHGAAIAIARGDELLYSRAFGWNWDAAAIGSQAQLLQRYSIVAHLAPEVRRGVELVRTKHDVTVAAAVTCGDYPDLRSLTMPLIQELDLEVETLDSVEGLIIPTTARREHLPDSLSAVRLACAAAAGRRVRGLQVDVVRIARAAGYAVAVASLAWIGYVWWARPAPGAAARAPEGRAQRPAASRPVAPPRRSDTRPPSSTATAQREPAPAAPPPPLAAPPLAAPPAMTSGSQPRSSSRAPSPQLGTGATARRAPADRELPSKPPEPPASRAERRTGRTPPAAAPLPRREQPRPAQPAPVAAERSRPRQGTQQPAAAPAPVPTPAPPASASPAPPIEPAAAPSPRPAPLKDPLPVIDTILVSSDRRLAVIDGAFAGIGDMLGQRTVVRIEVDAVFFREPSGLEIRVPIRMRRAP